MEADVQLLRVARWWDAESYEDLDEAGERGATDPQLRAARAAYRAEQAAALEGAFAPAEAFVAVSLSPARRARGEVAAELLEDPRSGWDRWRSQLSRVSLGSARDLAEVERDHELAEEMFDRVRGAGHGARPADLAEVEWLVRRASTRGLGEPVVDGLHHPRAVLTQRNGRSRLTPCSADLLAWAGHAHWTRDAVQVAGELGDSWQTTLVAESLPVDDLAPSVALEVMWRPCDRLPFPVDVTLATRYVSPARAQQQVRAEMAKADEAADEEYLAARGVSDATHDRTQVARDAESYLGTGEPLFAGVLQITVAASSREELRRRVREAKSAWAAHGVRLRLPLAIQQMYGWWTALPGQRPWVRGFTRRMSAEQIGAFAPTATRRLGGGDGWVWGHTCNAAATVVRWNPADGSRLDRAAGVLMVGDSGAGKTTAGAKLAMEAALDEAIVFDSTGKKDDHHWQTHPALGDRVDVVMLGADRNLRGLLDPWRNAPPELRSDAATDFLSALLPRLAPAVWETELQQAVAAVREHEQRPTNSHVLRVLRQRGGDEAIALVEHLETYATNGLAQLGFAPLDGSVRAIGDRQITCMVTENLPVPARGVSRAEYEPLERQGAALTKLIALLGMGVMSRFPDRQKFMCFDEARLLLDDPAGRRMIDSAQRLGRSKQVVPVIATQYAADVGLERGSVGALFGSVWAFRAVDEDDARKQCELLGIEPDAATLQRQTQLERGQATVRDHRGQVETIQVVLPDSLRQRVETNPLRRAAQQREAVSAGAR
ncbi:MAG: ATP-binding protein [Baekduiaceae bacterium]